MNKPPGSNGSKVYIFVDSNNKGKKNENKIAYMEKNENPPELQSGCFSRGF